MKPAPSLRARLVVLVGGGLLVLLAGAFLSTALVLEERQEDMIDALLDEQMSYSLQLYHSLGRAPSLNVPDMHFYVITPGAPTSVPAAFLHFSPGDHEAVVDGREYHLAVAEENGRRFVLAYDVEQPENDFAELLAILGLAFGLASVAVLGGIFWLSGRALRHLDAQQQLPHRMCVDEDDAAIQPWRRFKLPARAKPDEGQLALDFWCRPMQPERGGSCGCLSQDGVAVGRATP